MSGYSVNTSRVFRDLEPQSIFMLLHLVSSLHLPKKALVESRYGEQARHFDQTFDLLKSIGWIQESAGMLAVTDKTLSDVRWPATTNTARQLVDAVLRSSTAYGATLRRYLGQFNSDEHGIIHAPRAERRAKHSAVRNFLIRLGLVLYRRRTNDYKLAEGAVDLWVRAKALEGPRNKEKLLLKVQEREQLGSHAEDAVVEYERQRLGELWASYVDHVARKHPLASYDIESITVADGEIRRRFIEVKAVSRKSFRFFWSKEEVDTARWLAGEYFLYLLPVESTGRVDVASLRIIENAYANVYSRPDEWVLNDNVLLCHPRVLRNSEVIP